MSQHGGRRRSQQSRWRALVEWCAIHPGSDRDRRRSAKLARALIVLDAGGSGLIYTLVPDAVTSGNVRFVRELFPLQLWGVVWLVCAVVVCTRRREAAYSMLALTYVLFAIGTAVTFFTGDMDAPAGPLRVLALAGVHWWLRSRAIARSNGTLTVDDIALSDTHRR